MLHAIDIPPKIIEAMRISLVGKMRQYMSRIETLVVAIVVTYRHSNITRSYVHGYQWRRQHHLYILNQTFAIIMIFPNGKISECNPMP